MRTWLVPILLATLAAGCDHVVDSPRPDARTPLIEAVLVAGSEVTRFRLRWLDPAVESLSPVLVDDLALELVHPDGTHATWEPDPDSVGIYLATLPIAGGATYQLRGAIGGHPIAATTNVPGPLVIEQPAGDTLFLTGFTTPSRPERFDTITIRWRAAGATVLAIDSATVLFSTSFTHARDVRLGVTQTAGQPVGPTIRFVAMNADGDRYHFNVTGPETNITGGFGVFGAAAELRRIVRWR